MTNKTKAAAKPAAKADQGDATMEAERRSVVPLKWQRAYAKHEDKALKGTCADAVAKKLRALTTKDGKLNVGALVKVCKLNGFDPLERWPGKNQGMLRMNASNVLRGKAKRGEPISWPK